MPEKALTLVASDVAPVGGMERVALELCGRLLERGWDLTIIARSCTLPAGPRIRFVRILAPSRPVSVALAASWIHGSLLVLIHRRGLLQMNNPVLANRVDVVHAHFSERAFRERVAISRSSRPTLPYRLNSWLAAALELAAERWSYRPARLRRVVAVSQGLAREIAGYYPAVGDAVIAIPNGVDWQEFQRPAEERSVHRSRLGVGNGQLLALFVGGDWRRKGLRHAIAGVAGAPGWRLAILGEGDVESARRFASQVGAANLVEFIGRGRPHGWYAAADALLLPSSYEAFSLVMLEAAAAGLPLLVPQVNGAEELVQEGVNGWFVPPAAEQIAQRLRELAADPARLEAMGSASREAARRFDWERVVDRFEQLYEELRA
jgi:UDP-glucose:(heptosyl)LPS alpha-1,3-glucosyltransferase